MDSFARLCDTTARCLSRYENLVAERTVLAAVSGGVDSTGLLRALARLRDDGRLQGPLRACHVDHGVRPDSRDNAQHVVDLCDRLDVPITVRRLQFDNPRPSEDELRQGRYRALLQVAAEQQAGLLVTAHHADDNLETVLFRMLRGTGPRGLAGIPEARWLGRGEHRLLLVRPLLRTRRTTLESVLNQIGETAYHDTTNLDPSYARNQLRLEMIPQLRQSLGIGLDVALMTVASTARAANEIVEAQGLRILSQRARHKTAWRCELDLRGLDENSLPFVEEAAGGRRTFCCTRTASRHPPSGCSGSWRCCRWTTANAWPAAAGCWSNGSATACCWSTPTAPGAPPADPAGQLFRWDGGRQRFGATEWTLAAFEHPMPPLVPSPNDAGRLRALLDPRGTVLPWRLRARRSGDRFRPLGCAQELELRRFLQSRHVPRFDRDRLPLLVDAQDRVLWVPGVEVGEPARLQLNTRRCVEVVASCG